MITKNKSVFGVFFYKNKMQWTKLWRFKVYFEIYFEYYVYNPHIYMFEGISEDGFHKLQITLFQILTKLPRQYTIHNNQIVHVNQIAMYIIKMLSSIF